MTLVQCLDSAADPRHLDTAEAMFPFLCNANIGQDSVFQSGGGGSLDQQQEHQGERLNPQAPPRTS